MESKFDFLKSEFPNLSSRAPLFDLKDRWICSDCKQSMKYFCYFCHLVNPALQSCIPKVKLPISLDMYL